MKTSIVVKKILSFANPFKWLFILALTLNFIFSTLSVLSISLIKPIFEIIFEGKTNDTASQISTVPGIEIGFLEQIKNSFYDAVTSLIIGGKSSLQTTLLRFGILIFVVFLTKNIVKYCGGIINNLFEESVIKNIRDTIFKKLNSLSIDYFNKTKAGNLMSVITNDVSTLNSSTIGAFSGAFRDVIQVILFLFLLISISARLTLVSFFAGMLILLIVRISTKYLRRYASRIQQAMADFTTTMSEIISGIRVVKAFNGEQSSINRFTQDTGYYVKSVVKYQKISSLVPVLSELAAIAALCLVLLQGGTLILNGELTASDLMLFLFSVFSIMQPILNITNSFAQFQRGYVAAERVFSVLGQVPSVVDGVQTNIVFNKNIELQNVSFSYLAGNENERHYVLKNINLIIEKGQQIAFVGSSGSGKSTMLDLLIRFYDPTEGEILIDGINLKEYDTKAYRGLFGVVSQENILFNDTVKNNITFGYDSYSTEDLENAAITSNSYKFVQSMPQKFDTYLGDRGVNISGGERQRIAIARALLRKPQILIFDEATSALDAASEKIVQGAIDSSLENKTAIIVAHRLSTIISCDKIVVFDDGEIVEQGTHSQLMTIDGHYAHLYNLQYKKQ